MSLRALCGHFIGRPFTTGWIDHFDADGAPLVDYVPASSLYHLMMAGSEVARTFLSVARRGAGEPGARIALPARRAGWMILLAGSSATGKRQGAPMQRDWRVRRRPGCRISPPDRPGLPNDFDGVVSQLLDEFAAADFRSAERVLDTMRRQGRTISGYPRIRPSDCDRVIRAIRAAFDANRPLFVTGDRTIIYRFDNFLEAFARTDVRLYPRELMQARILQAEAKLLLHDPEGARELIGEYADRPYKIEGDRDDISRLMRLDCQARAAAGAVDGLGRLSVDRALALSRIWPYKVRSIASDFIGFMSLGRDAPARAGLLTWLLCQSARKTARARIGGGSFFRQIMRRPVAGLGLWLAAASLFLLRFGDLRLASPAAKLPKREIVVSRAMGGIGDLFVMTPGLRALSRRYSTKVKLVIDRKYFDIFRNNPHVELVDIDGPPVDVARARVWYNLTLCPAGQYEAARRPFVKRGRAQLFARGMGVGTLALYRHGWNVEYVLDDQMIAFRDAFLRDAGLGARPIVGVQPYARDS